MKATYNGAKYNKVNSLITFTQFIFYLLFYNHYVITLLRWCVVYLMLRINCRDRDLFLSQKLVINDPFIYGMT